MRCTGARKDGTNIDLLDAAELHPASGSAASAFGKLIALALDALSVIPVSTTTGMGHRGRSRCRLRSRPASDYLGSG